MKKLTALNKFPGVVFYESDRRRLNGKPERCFYIRYKNSLGKLIVEKIGWESEGITAAYAYHIRGERTRAIRLGDEVLPIQLKKKQAVSFAEFMEGVYLPYSQNNKLPKSYQRDYQLYHTWIKPQIGEKPLKDISPFDIERIKKVMKDQGLAPRTIEYAIAVIRHAFNKAKAANVFTGENPTSKVAKPKADNKRIRYLSPSEAYELLAACRNRSQQLYEICLLSLHTGMRAGEIFNLTWADVNLENNLIHIKDPKNKANRVAYMSEEVKDMFMQKEKGEPWELVFKDKKGKKIVAISKTFEKVVDELGLNKGIADPRDKVVFHTLRHTFASWLAIEGTPIYTIKELLGHKTLTMTERYSHLIPDAKREAIKAISKNISQVEGKVLEMKK